MHKDIHVYTHMYMYAHVTMALKWHLISSCDDPYLVIATTVSYFDHQMNVIHSRYDTYTCMLFFEMMVNFIELGTFLPYLEVAKSW